jgi:hypothetical protein
MSRRQYIVALAVLFVGGLLGGALSRWLLPGRVAWAQGGEATHEVVVARQFRLAGVADETRASLVVAAPRPVA